MDLGGVAGWAGLGVTQSMTALYYLIYRLVGGGGVAGRGKGRRGEAGKG